MSTPPVEPTPASIEGLHNRVTALENVAPVEPQPPTPYPLSFWQKVDAAAHNVLWHAKNAAHALAGTSIAALAWKLFQHLS